MKSLSERVLGVSSVDEGDAVRTAYNTLTGEELSPNEFQKECKRLDDLEGVDEKKVPPSDTESFVTLGILRQIFQARQIHNSNTLQNWPNYEAAFRQQDPAPQQEQDWALQVGCYTPVSAGAFSALAHDVYGAKPLNIDLTFSRARAQLGAYAATNALGLGILDERIIVAQTNCLLNMLKNPDDTSQNPHAIDLFKEVHRVLRPGGHGLFYELTPGLNFKEHPTYESDESQERIAAFKEGIARDLARVGFVSITVEPARAIRGVDYLFDPTRDFSRYPAQERAGIVMVSAKKPEFV